MAISKLYLENFTVFERTEIDFSDGINVFIGENGTGKTQLLKILYFFTFNLKNDFGLPIFEEIFTKDLVDTIRDKNENSDALLDCTINGQKEKLRCSIWKTPEINIPEFGGKVRVAPNKPEAIFIPAKEMLSHSNGFLALERERTIPFDKTLIDIIAKAQLGATKKMSELHKKLLPMISEIIGGKVIYEGDIFYVEKENGLKIEFSMEAEGLRKFGLLWKLIQNGLIEKGTVLFWDEPEANINPMNIPVLVDILLELQRHGVQIFVSTHDYIFAKYFEVKRREQDSVMFYSLYNSENGVQCEKNSYFKDLRENPIVKAFDKLLDEVYDKHLGE